MCWFSVSTGDKEIDNPHVGFNSPSSLQGLQREDEVVGSFAVNNGKASCLCQCAA